MDPLTSGQPELDAIREREQAATPGPWGWRGHLSASVELRTIGQGGKRIITTMRSMPCMGYDGTTIYLNEDACATCRTAYETTHLDERVQCEKPENLDTVWVWGPDGACEPVNKWAKAEVLQWSDHMYRDDVKDTTHPDAEFIAHAREDVARLLAVADRLLALADEWEAIGTTTWGQIELQDCDGALAGFKAIGAEVHRNHAKAIRDAVAEALAGQAAPRRETAGAA
jgi:hypothetical protein